MMATRTRLPGRVFEAVGWLLAARFDARRTVPARLPGLLFFGSRFATSLSLARR
jgi:hypothetical protein